MKKEQEKDVRRFFVITGGCLGYLDMEVAHNLSFDEIREQVISYNKLHNEEKTGCHMHYEVRETNTIIRKYEF